MKPSSSSRSLAGAFILALGAAPSAPAQTAPSQLAPVVTAATRLPEAQSTVGSDTELIPASDLEARQVADFSQALAGAAAAPIFATGREGASASLFLRGANSNQTLFLVDGIRLNDANADYGPFLGGARLLPGESLEIARGAQSTLYGSEAAGGVVSLAQAKGAGPFSGAISAEAGSFGSLDGTLSAQGAGGGWAYDLAAAGSRTDNDRPNNTFDSGDLALRLDRSLGAYLAAGATVRGFDARYGDPGDEFTNNPYAYEQERNWLATLFFDARWSENVSSHLVLGGQDRRLDSVDRTATTPAVDTAVKNRRGVIDWQNTLQLTAHNRLVAGLTAEEQTTDNNGFGAIDRRQGLLGLYAEDEWTLFDQVYLTGGLRHDRYDTFGSADTGRLTAAWLTAQRSLKLRGSYGTAFDTPSFLDLYAQNPFFKGNPGVGPERTRSLDAGLDFYAPDGETVSATWFQNDFRDLIVDNFAVFPATDFNAGRARTRGVELGLETTVAAVLHAKLSYTRMLRADDLTDRTPLLRRPTYAAGGDLRYDTGGAVIVGAGASWVGTRADIDARTFATVADPGYAVARVYASWKLGRSLSLKARVENALDRRYEPVNGYPALGRAFFGGAEFRF